MYRAPHARKRTPEKRAIRLALKKSTIMPDGSPLKRRENLVGERFTSKILRRDMKRRDRHIANMQLLIARTDPETDVTGRPFVNLISATAHHSS